MEISQTASRAGTYSPKLSELDARISERFAAYRIRPLNRISDFVKDQLPSLLEKARNTPMTGRINLGEQVSLLLSRIDPIRAIMKVGGMNDRRLLAVATLDLAMLVSALSRHDVPIPEKLREAHKIAAIALRVPECLTYELIIRSNPAHDMRTFCTGKTCRAERFFYLDHERVERVLNKAVTAARRARVYLHHGRFSDAEKSICTATELHAQSIDKMRRFQQRRGITREDFQIFRQYFEGFGGHPGPSGLYSPGEHGLRITVFGSVFADRMKLIQKQLPYFPNKSHPMLLSVIKQAQAGASIFELAIKQLTEPRSSYHAPLSTRESVHRLMSQICNDMQQHIEFVKHFVGASAPGTAGMSFEFLTKGYARACAARDALGLTFKEDNK